MLENKIKCTNNEILEFLIVKAIKYECDFKVSYEDGKVAFILYE